MKTKGFAGTIRIIDWLSICFMQIHVCEALAPLVRTQDLEGHVASTKSVDSGESLQNLTPNTGHELITKSWVLKRADMIDNEQTVSRYARSKFSTVPLFRSLTTSASWISSIVLKHFVDFLSQLIHALNDLFLPIAHHLLDFGQDNPCH
ncbi:hypothetical protein KCU85_g3, partial [Aureobasidium melanogenum]